MDNIRETFVINLKHCTNRLEAISTNLKENRIEFTVWDAVDGKKLTQDEIDENTTFICRKFLCNYGIVGCHLSHLYLWKHIVSKYGMDENKWFLILEDDAKLLPGFLENLTNIMNDLKHWKSTKHSYPELIHLSCDECKNEQEVTPYLFTSKKFITTRGYMVSVKGAYKLSKILDIVKYHVDMALMYHQCRYNNLSYYISNNFVGSNDNRVSTIGGKTFPRLMPDILNKIIPLSDNPYHVFYDGPVFSINMRFDVNICIIVLLFILVVLLIIKLYLIAFLYVLFEVLYYLISRSKQVKKKC